MSIPQLRIRSEFTFKGAYGPAPRIAERLKAIDAPCGGIVDLNGTWGHGRFERAMLKEGIAALFGIEMNVLVEDDKAQWRKFHKDWPTAWALADDLAAFYRFTSSNPETPEQWAHAAGIVRFSGSALKDPACFDYVDINPSSMLRCRENIALARYTGKPLVLTGDNNYPAANDRDRYLALVDGKKTTPQWILNDEEMRAAFWFITDELFEEAVRGAIEVGERLSGRKLRQAPMVHVVGDLPPLVEAGRKYRLNAGHIREWTQAYQDRLEREMALIHEKDFESYFLVVSDLVCWAKERMLVGPGRGSSAGSLVCYLLRITEVDPLVHDLLFERFIDVNRNDLPDIDIDFDDTKRDQCFTYLAEKYGKDNVARIGNINTLKPRSAMAEVGKRIGVPANATFAVKNVLIEYSSGDSRYGRGLEDTLANTKPGQDMMRKYPEAELMGEVEGSATHTGVHAAGVIVSNDPIIEYCTVRDGVTQLDKPDAEYLNLLKIDALGLRTLGVISDSGCVTNELLYGLTLDDPAVFDIFNKHKFSGIFQFEGAAQRRVSIQIPVTSFKQIDHVTALARPGPLGGGGTNSYIRRNNGEEEIDTIHPLAEPYIKDTHGVMLYQEQIMFIGRNLGELSWKEVTLMRKAMSGRKGEEYFDQLRQSFMTGAVKNGMTEEIATKLWRSMVTFGAWGMNRCAAENTRVKLAHPNQFLGPDPTIGELYKYYKEAPSSWIRQRKTMPVVLAFDGETAKPVMAVDIHKNGKKPCIRMEFDDGRVIECTADHKFIINGVWSPCGSAVVGDEFSAVSRKKWLKNTAVFSGKGWRKGRKGNCTTDVPLGNKKAADKFKVEHSGMPCEDCRCAGRMEVHHNDFVHGLERPNDMAWLCSSCHKLRHKVAGNWGAPNSRGWTKDEPAVLLSVSDAGELETYDIEMPDPHHNYVLANGILTHNSHTVSYSIISYWCAYMKAYHPMEFAAACLRSAKDDEQVVEILRELSKEGVSFIAFDPMKSDRNWSAQDGQLVGGFTNLHGIGPAKAEYYVQKRSGIGLDEKDLEKLAKYPPKNEDLRPAHSRWGHIYENPELENVAGRIREIGDLKDNDEAVVICKVVKKERRDENETLRKARRGNTMEGQTLFLDIIAVDDSISKPVVVRVRPNLWHEYGQKIADRAIDGQEWLLVRGRWLDQFSIMIVKKVKCLSNPELFADET